MAECRDLIPSIPPSSRENHAVSEAAKRFPRFIGIPEDDIVQQAMSGDADANGWLFCTYQPRVMGYACSRVSNIDTAQDLTSDVMERVFSHLPSYQKRGNIPFSSWLFRIAHNHVANHFRTISQRGTTISIEALEALGQRLLVQSQEDRVLDSIQGQELRAGLYVLTEAQREVIELRFFAGLSPSEIASVLGKRTGNVKVLQHKAIKKLKKSFGEMPGNSQAARKPGQIRLWA